VKEPFCREALYAIMVFVHDKKLFLGKVSMMAGQSNEAPSMKWRPAPEGLIKAFKSIMDAVPEADRGQTK
jgi:hypothetical protein